MFEAGSPSRAGSDGGAADVPAIPTSPSCLSTMASFTEGLRDDLAASIGPQWLNRNNDPAVDGVSVTRGYGTDLTMLTTEFSVNREQTFASPPTMNNPTLSFGGWKNDDDGGGRGPRALHAAEQLWGALGSAVTSTVGTTTIHQTTGGRVSCARQVESGFVANHCVLTGFIFLDTAETPCTP
jgi:hypothetical protein